jgi:hypothetical protein
MAGPADAARGIRAAKIRNEAETLDKAALIAGQMDCPSLANSISLLASAKRKEAKTLTQVSAREKI